MNRFTTGQYLEHSTRTFLLIRLLELVFACVVLFFFFEFTGQGYSASGQRTVLQAAEDSALTAALYEIFLWYFVITAVVWTVMWALRLRRALFVLSVPLIYVLHATLVCRMLSWPFTLQLGAAVLAMAFFDTIIAFLVIGKPRTADR